MVYKIGLRIADIVILLRSSFKPFKLSRDQERVIRATERFKNFLYRGRRKPDIFVDIEVVHKLPQILHTRPLFITRHFQDNNENWRLRAKGDKYIYKSPLERKRQLMIVDKGFRQVKAYLFRGEGNFSWRADEVIYDFLQVLLINYFALRGNGIFVHSVGVKDRDGKGLVFAGRSGAGKSTTARIWHKHSNAIVLNDDRIIVRKIKDKFLVYGSPWHGEFSDYLNSRMESAPLERLLFIYHHPENKARPLLENQAFSRLYPALFPTFWDKYCLQNIAALSHEMVKRVPCFSLGFVNSQKIIAFVRNL